MPRNKSKVGISSARSYKPIVITAKNWQAIESKYGHPLQANLRTEVQKVTDAFVSLAIAEINAASVVDARSATKTLLSAGKAFQRALTEPAEMNGRFYAFHLVRNYLRDDRLGDHIAYPGPLANLRSVLSSFVTACEKSLAELCDHGRAEIMVGHCQKAATFSEPFGAEC